MASFRNAMRGAVRRSLVLATVVALLIGAVGISAPAIAASPWTTTVAGVDVDATTIPELQALMDDGTLSSVDLVSFYLKRIKQLNPRLNAVITVNSNALAEAAAADEAHADNDDRPLLGIPIIVKDNINTAGTPTTAGSWALAGSTPDDAFIIERPLDAGAIVLGKANLSEWANFRSGPSWSGWSGIGEQTNMPYVLDRNPCGSSSRSGVVAAADLAVAAVGTETDGSIVCPSAECKAALPFAGMSEHDDHAGHDHAAHEQEHHEHTLSYPDAIRAFRADKDEALGSDPHSPIPADDRASFAGLPYFEVDVALRFEGLALEPYAGDEPVAFQIPTSDGKLRDARRAGLLRFEVAGAAATLTAYQFATDPPGSTELFVPFLDRTSGAETYGAGRYLDLDVEDDGTYSLDFNLAYHPSCVYDPRFSCPLTPAENRLAARIEAGERLAEGH